MHVENVHTLVHIHTQISHTHPCTENIHIIENVHTHGQSAHIKINNRHQHLSPVVTGCLTDYYTEKCHKF